MTLPRELTLTSSNGDYYIKQSIVSEFKDISKPFFQFSKINNEFVKEYNLQSSKINFDVKSTKNQKFDISFSNKLGEEFIISFDNGMLKSNRINSGKVDFSESFANKVQQLLITDKIYNFSLIIDKSSVEILINDGTYSMTNLFFPSEEYKILKISNLAKTKINNLKIDTIEGVWNN